MKKKALSLIIKHLNDIQIMSTIDATAIEIMNRDIDFAKWLISECEGDLNQEIDVDEMWDKFLNLNKQKKQ